MKILIVDDSHAMQVIVRRGIEQLGYSDLDVRNANDGKKALDIIRTWEPDLILCDWHMPEMTGIELLKELNRQMLNINIGFVTTETSEERKREAYDCGAKFFVQKPFTYTTLHDAVIPVIQGSSDGEHALDNHQPAEHDENHIVLPDVESLNSTLSSLSIADLYVEQTDLMDLKLRHFPCLLGLFEDDHNMVRAVAIMDLQATCVLGAAATDIPEELVRKAINRKVVPKPFLMNCKKLMGSLSTCLYEEHTYKSLRLRSINIMRKRVTSINKLLQKPLEERVDIEVAVVGYGNGNLTLIVS